MRAISAAKAAPAEGAANIVASHYLDANAKALLEGVIKARDAKQTGYSNADLAEELLKSEHIKSGGADLSEVQRGVIQRLALVSRLFGVVGHGDLLPGRERPAAVSGVG